MLRLIATALSLVASLCVSIYAAQVHAQSYPSKPIRLVVPYPPGGTADLMARLLAGSASARIGQSIVVENRGGAGGNIAAEFVARSAPDGYTLIVGNAPILAINPSLFRKLAFDPLKDFAPIAAVAEVPLFLVTHPSAPFKSVPELIEAARRAPGKINYASGSNGSTTHLAMELFKSMAGIDMVHIPFKGSGPALQALVGGQVPVMFELIPSATPFVQSGQLKAIAVTSRNRSESSPQVKTVAEEGLAGFEVASWFGVLAPADTPQAVIDKLHRTIAGVASTAEFKSRLHTLGAQPMSEGPKDFRRLIESELKKWAVIVRESGARVE